METKSQSGPSDWLCPLEIISIKLDQVKQNKQEVQLVIILRRQTLPVTMRGPHRQLNVVSFILKRRCNSRGRGPLLSALREQCCQENFSKSQQNMNFTLSRLPKQ